MKASISKGKAIALTILKPNMAMDKPTKATHMAMYVRVSMEPSLPAKYRDPESNKITMPVADG
jgi:hypothetical protein